MFNVMMRFKIVDYSRWKAEFDADESWRRGVGQRDYQVFRDADDPSMVTVRLGWESMDTGQLFITSPQLRKKMQDGGVMGDPTYFFMNDVASSA